MSGVRPLDLAVQDNTVSATRLRANACDEYAVRLRDRPPGTCPGSGPGRGPRPRRRLDNAPMPSRCNWAPEHDPEYLAYHDEEWGVPSRDDRHLYEMLVLEGAQAGLSWATILHKREGYRAA